MRKILSPVLDLLLSLKTTLVLLLGLILLFLYGAIVMPLHEEFQMLHVVPLLQWMQDNPWPITWWLWASLGVLVVLTANTLVCSIDSLIRKRQGRHWLLIISPQIIHAAFLFILLAHLLSSVGSFRGTAFVGQGSSLGLPNGMTLYFPEINVAADSAGYLTDWSAKVQYARSGTLMGSDVIRPNEPSFRDGYGVYIKTVRMDPFPTALIEVSREPGSLWALIGGVLFLVGTTGLLAWKIRREERSPIRAGESNGSEFQPPPECDAPKKQEKGKNTP